MSVIVCLAPAPWQSTPTRTQQFLSRLKGAEVLYFEPPGARGEHRRPGRKVRPGVTAYTLPALWKTGQRQDFRFRRNVRRVADYIQDVLRRQDQRDPLLWCATPWAAHLLDYLPFKGLIYDCDRYWTDFPLDWESDLALSADVVFAASAGLADRLSPCCQNIAVIPNGCNYPMFAREDIEVPAPLGDLIGPLLGYAGTLWADLDYDPVFTCAAAHPDWNFLFLGRQEDSPGLRRLRGMEQVVLVDRCPLIQVPDYVRQCDVCLDLRRGAGAASDVLPGRVFEYLAAGKPVARHSFPGQVEDLPGLIYQSDDLHGFAAACERAMREESVWRRQRRREAGEQASWENRAREIQRILESASLL